MADSKTQVVITAKDDTAAGFASAEAGLQRLTGQFVSLTNPIAAAGAAMSVASAAIVASVKSAIDTGDQFNKLSQKTGIAVESLSGLAYAATLSDVSIESLAIGIKKLSVNMNEAAVSTSGKAAEAFKALGVAVKDSNGTLRGSDDVLADIADRFAGMKDGAGKTALAVALFGKAGADLIPFLNQGGKGIAELTAEAEKLGLVLTGKTAKAAEEFNDNMKKLSLSTAALGRSITADLIGQLSEYTRLMVEARKEGVGLIGSVAVGLRMGDTNATPLQELKDRASTLQGRLSNNMGSGKFPGMQARDNADKAELAILQKIIAARMKAAEDFGPPLLPTEKKDAPTFGGKDGADKESSYLAGLRQQLTAASGDLSEYSKQLLAITQGPAKDFSKTTKDAALALAQKIDTLKVATKANEDHAKVLEKVAHLEYAANKAVGDFGFKQEQNVSGIQSQTADLGKTPFEIRQGEAARAIEKDYEEAVKKVNEDLGKIGDIEGISQKTYELSQRRDKALISTAAALKENKDRQDALNASVEHGANESLRQYDEMAKAVGKSTGDALTRGLSMAEDALVDFVKNGKLNFKSLADYAISEFIRISTVRPAVNALAATVKDSGGIGSLLSSAGGFFKSLLPSFAVGTDFVPFDMVAQIHKGERIVPAAQNNGGGSSVVIQQHIYPSPGVSSGDLMQAMVQAKNAAIAEIHNSQRRGGVFA